MFSCGMGLPEEDTEESTEQQRGTTWGYWRQLGGAVLVVVPIDDGDYMPFAASCFHTKPQHVSLSKVLNGRVAMCTNQPPTETASPPFSQQPAAHHTTDTTDTIMALSPLFSLPQS